MNEGREMLIDTALGLLFFLVFFAGFASLVYLMASLPEAQQQECVDGSN